jgi:hypothetical protein
VTATFLEPGITSEDLIDNIETPPEIAEETTATRVAEAIGGRSVCPYCNEPISKIGMGPHKRYKHPEEFAAEKAAAKSPARKTAAKKIPAERKPTTPKEPVGRRVKADDLIATTMRIVGAGLMQTGVSLPTGKALQLEATLLGTELDNAVSGTFLDKQLVQPLVKTKGRFEHIAPLIAFPVMIGLLDKNPAMLPQLYPMLRLTVMQMLPSLVAAKKKELADAEKLKDAARELGDLDPELREIFASGDMDPIDLIIQSLFPVDQQPTVVEEPGSAWADDATASF